MMRRAVTAIAVLLAASSLIYAIAVIRRGFSTHTEPSALEIWIAKSVRNLATPRDAKALSNPLPNSPEVVREGMRHFADHCAICHANNGSGDTEIGRALYPKAPDMRIAATQNLSDGELYYVIQNGIRLTGMPGWGDSKNAHDSGSWALVHFIRRLPSLSESELLQMQRWNPKPQPDEQDIAEEEEFLGSSVHEPPQHDHKHQH